MTKDNGVIFNRINPKVSSSARTVDIFNSNNYMLAIIMIQPYICFWYFCDGFYNNCTETVMSNGFGPTDTMSEILSRNYQRQERCSILFIVLLTEPKDQWGQITFLSLFYINTTKRSKTIDLFKVSVVLTTSLTEESINQDHYYSHNFQQKPNNVTIQQGLNQKPQ